MAYTTIDDPSAHFQTVLYTGNGAANHAITNGGNSDLQPDFVWIKNRDAADSHCLFDSTRGATKVIHSDVDIDSEFDRETIDADTLDSFASDGFQVDADVKVNTNTEAYVAWQWKANGGSTSSNTVGTITSTVQVNTTAGFSIVAYGPGTGAAATVGHGLGVAPDLMLIKNRTAADKNWRVYHSALGGTKRMELNNTSAVTAEGNYDFNDTDPTATVFSIANDGGTNEVGSSLVAYCFADIQGYSKFGTYESNRVDDGTFVYLGFKPAFVMLKSIDDTSYWFLVDNKRNSPAEGSGNPIRLRLRAEETTADDTSDDNRIDFLSNGFKLRDGNGGMNGWNAVETYIYMAFAHQPFVTSGGVPCTAR